MWREINKSQHFFFFHLIMSHPTALHLCLSNRGVVKSDVMIRSIFYIINANFGRKD